MAAGSDSQEAGAARPVEVPGAARETDAPAVESANSPGCTSTRWYRTVGSTPNIRARARMSWCRQRERTPARVKTSRHSLHRLRLSDGPAFSSCRDTLTFPRTDGRFSPVFERQRQHDTRSNGRRRRRCDPVGGGERLEPRQRTTPSSPVGTPGSPWIHPQRQESTGRSRAKAARVPITEVGDSIPACATAADSSTAQTIPPTSGTPGSTRRLWEWAAGYRTHGSGTTGRESPRPTSQRVTR